ncbi:MAG: hypothetical protein F6K54_02220 [Okeania sp. SIO3B5]|uniref:hypothetical protein n=1 Tax=Okeania sp. SIO3B5 TaxID=2607811 RepID=UPI0014019D86|nr:hypothetical protein [Okeania sp. SIO3B5]NEO52009.1 hypothetical protein [Okeania sp. SIO3B5]
MNKESLLQALNAAIAKYKDEPTARVVFGLAKQVWQIDWTVAPFDILNHYLEFDISYFYRFMSMDIGDEAEEQQLLKDWIDTRHALDKEGKRRLPQLADELNQLRVAARNA